MLLCGSCGGKQSRSVYILYEYIGDMNMYIVVVTVYVHTVLYEYAHIQDTYFVCVPVLLERLVIEGASDFRIIPK